ncbi:hypothetical protein F5146DRAFT_1099011 [Armillaria mellea]|nr:hypothetical protein F5146DRAFT_1099011 [Armillaria mellea]
MSCVSEVQQSGWGRFSKCQKCDEHGQPLPPDTAPSSLSTIPNVWSLFNDEVQFHLADFLFCKVEMSQRDIDDLLDLWALDLHKHEGEALFDNHQALYQAINEIHVGSTPWKCFQMVISPNLMEFDTAPYVHLDANNKQRWSDFMSGNYFWCHATQIYELNHQTEGATYMGIIISSNKTTVSVMMGNVEYYPVYLSIRNLHNSAHHGHRNRVVPIAFLVIPKAILCSLQPAMSVPIVRMCLDGFYRRVIYDLGPYIANYPEQVLLAGIIQGWCARCTAPSILLESLSEQGDVLWDNYGIDEDIMPFTFNFPHTNIHEMMSSDLLHQIIKGSFKDHLVEWVYDYLVVKEGETCTNIIIDDIDHWITAIPPFPGLQCFPQGHRFKQWTGDNSKALMKVYLAAIAGMHDDFSLPRQHAIVHYPSHIMEFGTPNSLCSLITESQHITAIKKPCQMLLTNQWLDKLMALHIDLVQCGLLESSHAPPPDPFDICMEDEGAVDGECVIAEVLLAKMPERRYPKNIQALGHYVGHLNLQDLTEHFLYEQLEQSSSQPVNTEDRSAKITSPIFVFHSAIATFYSPSDISSIRGMQCEHEGIEYPCALVHWFKRHGHAPDPKTGMRNAVVSVIHLDTLLHGAHLMFFFGPKALPPKFHYSRSLDCFTTFYISRYADHHMHEII